MSGKRPRSSDSRSSEPEQVCPHCSFTTPWPGTLRIHVEAEHSGLRPFRCPQCTYAGATEGTLQMHMRRKHSDGSGTKMMGRVATAHLPAASGQAAAAVQIGAGNSAIVAASGRPTLVLGECDFSFAVALTTVYPGLGPSLVATSHASPVGKLSKCKNKNLRLLRKRGVALHFEVDATAIAETLPDFSTTAAAAFHRVLFCFPRATTICGQQPDSNTPLLAGFFSSAAPLLRQDSHRHGEEGAGAAVQDGGRIVLLLHVCWLNGVAADQWDEWGVAAIAAAHGLERCDVVGFDSQAFPQYQPRAVHGRPFVPDEALFHFLRLKPTHAEAAAAELR